jgi:hypothetical protein
MSFRRNVIFAALTLVISFSSAASSHAANTPIKLRVEWKTIIGISKADVSIQVCPEPPMLRDHTIHNQLYSALHDLGANYARLQPWFPYPRMAVAELKPPQKRRTFWDFSLMDQITEDFMRAAKGHPVVFDFGTIPEWMFKTKAPVKYPANPDQIDWNYEQGTELRDPSMREAAKYQARLVSWYTTGGLRDEYGKWHASGHHYKIAYWEVLNEVDGEHHMTPQYYTRLYDAIVTEILRVSPNMKFMGLALSDPVDRPDFFQYFLDHKNHKAGIPIDMISYHFYSMPDPDETPETMQYTIFDQADKFLAAVRYIQSIRERLSPGTGTDVDELGSMLPDPQATKLTHPIPESYWNLAGAMWAYLYGHLARLGINVVGGAELIDYPGQYAATTLVNWETGQPNARYWVLKLLRDNFDAGDKLVRTQLQGPYLYAQAFVTPEGKQKILLVNKRNLGFTVSLPGGDGAHVEVVDQMTASEPPATSTLAGNDLTLPGFAVAVVTLTK